MENRPSLIDNIGKDGKEIVLGFKILVTCVVVSTLLVSCVLPGVWLMRNMARDLPSYYLAGRIVAAGGNPYSPFEFIQEASRFGIQNRVYPYIYFPALALSFTLVADMPYENLQPIWFGVNLLFLVTAGVFMMHLPLRSPRSSCRNDPYRLMVIFVLGCSMAGYYNLIRGQVNFLILMLLACFLNEHGRSRSISSGICLGLAGIIKPQPMILVLILMIHQRWLSALTALIVFSCGVMVSASACGWENFMYYIQEVVPAFNMVSTGYPPIQPFVPANQSLQGIVSRLLMNTQYSLGVWHLPAIVPLISRISNGLLILISVVALVWRSRNRISELMFFYHGCGWLLIVSLLISPLTWDHHYVFLSIPFIFAFSEWRGLQLGEVAVWLFPALWVLINLPFFPFAEFWNESPLLTFGISIKGLLILVLWVAYGSRFVVNFPRHTKAADLSRNQACGRSL